MLLTITAIFAIGIVGGFFMSAFMGANDVSNAMGATLGCKALRLRNIIILAVIFELLGALLLGSFVSERVSSGLIDPPAGDVSDFQVREYMLAMCCVLIGTGVWLCIATILAVPVSTTHSVIGSVIAVSVFMNGFESVKWMSLLTVALGWVIAPMVGMVCSFFVWIVLKKLVIQSSGNSERRMLLAMPFLVCITFFTLGLFVLYQGTKAINIDVPIYIAAPSALLIAVVLGAASWFFAVPMIRKNVQNAVSKAFDIEDFDQTATDGQDGLFFDAQTNESDAVFEKKGLLDDKQTEQHYYAEKTEQISYGTETGDFDPEKQDADIDQQGIEKDKGAEDLPLTREEFSHESTEKYTFNFLVIITSCCIATAHGSNDISNAAGPMATVAKIFMEKGIPETGGIPMWVTLIAGVGLVVGLAALGYRVMRTLGEKITKLTASRAFVAQLTTSTITLVSSALGLPLSTTHVTVGCVYGVSLVDIFPDIRKLQWRLVVNIMLSWIITIPAAALATVASFFLLRLLL